MLNVVPSVEITTREDFALLANGRGLGYAVEVGVEMGVNAKTFLDKWHGQFILLVDPYEPYPQHGWLDRSHEILAVTLALQAHHGRYHLIRGHSTEIAAKFPSWFGHGQPSFVYLDAGHDYPDIRADIAAWWPVVAEEGILAGHDYDEKLLPGVYRAVNEFAERERLTIRTTHERHCKSWYAYKTEPRQLLSISKSLDGHRTDNPRYKGR